MLRGRSVFIALVAALLFPHRALTTRRLEGVFKRSEREFEAISALQSAVASARQHVAERRHGNGSEIKDNDTGALGHILGFSGIMRAKSLVPNGVKEGVKEGEKGETAQTQEDERPQEQLAKWKVPPKRTTFGKDIKTLYHLTVAGHEIRISGEMLRGSGGIVGGGIYFAASEQECRKKAKSDGWLLTAKVLVGKAKVVDMSKATTLPFAYVVGKQAQAMVNQWDFKSLQAKGFDSVQIVGLRTGDEYIVYNKDQVEILEVEQLNETKPEVEQFNETKSEASDGVDGFIRGEEELEPAKKPDGSPESTKEDEGDGFIRGG